MRLERACVALILAAGLVVFPACAGENQDETLREFTKGGDDRTGEYDAVVDLVVPSGDFARLSWVLRRSGPAGS